MLPKSCIEKYVRFCVTSKLALEKCQDFKLAAYANRLRPQVECHQETSIYNCLTAIRLGKADVMAADVGHVYEAHKLVLTLVVEEEKWLSECVILFNIFQIPPPHSNYVRSIWKNK